MGTKFLLAVSACCLLTQAALADPMPTLPYLPPLPIGSEAAAEFGNFYAGVLGGPSLGPTSGGAMGLVLGHTVFASELVLGIEGQSVLTFEGRATVEGVLRLGLPLNPDLNVFADLGLGYSSLSQAYTSIGTSADVALGQGWDLRAQYKYNYDLSGDPAHHTLLTGLLRHF